MDKARVGVLGATGYVGVELIRILHAHPRVALIIAGSSSAASQPLSDAYPNFARIADLVLESDEAAVEKADVVFASLPHGLSEGPARECFSKGKLFIDMGADFRLREESDYKAYYGGAWKDAALHGKAVYGLPELYRNELKSAAIIANPGCYPTCAALGLYPALSAGLVGEGAIAIDALSGLSGAGKSLTQETHFVDANEAVNPYKVTSHRHRPEIAQTLAAMAGKKVKFCFVPHLVPVSRGMLCTEYVPLSRAVSELEIRKTYQDFYAREPFVRVMPAGKTAGSRWVRYSNYCDISVHVDEEARTLIVASAIDNMVKGSAGMAIQGMNLACGFPETEGLDLVPPAF